MEIRLEIEKSQIENKTEQKTETLNTQRLADLLSEHSKTFIEATVPNLGKLTAEIQGEVNKNSTNYELLIEKLMELRDVKNNISWHKIKSPTGEEIIVRNAIKVKKPDTKVKKPDLNVDKEAFLIQAINYVRAARAVMGHDFEEYEVFYKILFKHFMANLQNAKDANSVTHEFNLFTTVFINTFASHKNLPVKEVISQLTVARDFCNLEEPTKDVVTLTQLKNNDGKDVIVFQGEIALTKLTNELINEYTDRKRKIWYDNLTDWQKKLVEQFVEKILQGNRVIPTQLRKILPGTRNAFHNIVGVIEDNHAVVLNDNPHSGTIAYYGSDTAENKSIAVLHAKQLKQNANVNHLITLNTPTNPLSEDKKIVDESNYAMKKTGGFHSNLPLNWLRRGTSNNYDGIIHATQVTITYVEKMFNELSKKINVDLLKITLSYLKNVDLDEKDVQKLQAELLLLKNKSELNQPEKILIETLIMQVQLRYLISKNWNMSDPDNRNLSIGALANMIDSNLSKLDSKKSRTSSACQSGKDRDGLLIFKIDHMSINQYLLGLFLTVGSNPFMNQFYLENLKTLLLGGHTQFMAGYMGATLAAFGIKKDSIAAIPENEFPKELISLLVLSTASYNKEMPFENSLLPLEKIYYKSLVQDVDEQLFLIIHALILQKKLLEEDKLENSSSGIKFFTDALDIKVDDLKPQILTNAIMQLRGLIDKKASLDDVHKAIKEFKKQIENASQNLFNSKGPAFRLLEAIEFQLEKLKHEEHVQQKRRFTNQSH